MCKKLTVWGQSLVQLLSSAFPSCIQKLSYLMEGQWDLLRATSWFLHIHRDAPRLAPWVWACVCVWSQPWGRDPQPVFDCRACPATQLSAAGVGPASGMGCSRASSLSTNIVVCSHRVHRNPQILVVQVREPVWQVLHSPGIWVPSNLISTACPHWSCGS